MADKGPATPQPPTAHKPPVKTMTSVPPQPAPQAQQEQNAVQHAQQNLVQPPPPAQVTNPVPQPATPAQVPNPVQPPPPTKVPNPVPPIQVQVQPGQPQLNCSYFKPEFSDKPE